MGPSDRKNHSRTPRGIDPSKTAGFLHQLASALSKATLLRIIRKMHCICNKIPQCRRNFLPLAGFKPSTAAAKYHHFSALPPKLRRRSPGNGGLF